MQIRTALTPELAGDTSAAVCVVIDVLRATTVIATLFEQGCPRVYIAPSHDAERAFAAPGHITLCGETGGYKVPDFDYGNSPMEFSRLDFSGKPVVLSTTNGTKAAALVAGARRVFLGAAVNRMAVAKAVWYYARETQSDIVLVCSGTDDHFTLEDCVVAGMYVEAICGQAGAWEMPDQADDSIAARRLWQSEPNLIRSWMEGYHAQLLSDRGFGEDIGCSAAIDTLEHVPTLVTEETAATVAAPVILVG